MNCVSGYIGLELLTKKNLLWKGILTVFKVRDFQFTLKCFVEIFVFSFTISYLWTSKKRKIEVEIGYKHSKWSLMPQIWEPL